MSTDIVASKSIEELLALAKEGRGDLTDRRGSAVLDMMSEEEHGDMMVLLMHRLANRLTGPVTQAHVVTRILNVMAENLCMY